MAHDRLPAWSQLSVYINEQVAILFRQEEAGGQGLSHGAPKLTAAAVAPEPGLMTDKERLQSMTCFPHFRIDILECNFVQNLADRLKADASASGDIFDGDRCHWSYLLDRRTLAFKRNIFSLFCQGLKQSLRKV